MTEYNVQTVVVGAGVVGLACAAELARSGREVLVLEAEPFIGHGVSSRNSEVIHAGIYYPPGSLKAQVCVRGKQLLYEHCRQRHVDARAIGKLIVATTQGEIEGLESLNKRAIENGVDDIELIDAKTAMQWQPGLRCVAALHSPSTGIIDSHSFMVSLQAELESHGGMVVCNSPVDRIDIKNDGGFDLTISGDSAMTLSTGELVNSAGLNAVPLAHRTHNLDSCTIPQARYAKGNYFGLKGRAPFSKLIYPAPVVGGLGVHLTLDIGNQARFGPDVEWLDPQNTDSTTGGNYVSEQFNYEVDPARADSFYEAIRRYWPALPDNALIPDYAGMRPKIAYEDGRDIDFEISTPEQHRIDGLINLFGIESPGLTSSLAIAEIVRNAL